MKMQTPVSSSLPAQQTSADHPLLNREIRPIVNWFEWLKLWTEAKTYQELIGLLHYGFQLSISRASHSEPEIDIYGRVIHYLSVADGWNTYSALRLPDDGRIEFMMIDSNKLQCERTPSQLRQEIAQKAFEILCLNFFKDRSKCHDSAEYWENRILSERIFPIIMNFFRVERDESGDRVTVRNLTSVGRIDKRIHSEQFAVDFLLNLVRFIWTWKSGQSTVWFDRQKEEERLKPLRERIAFAKPWTIEVLRALGELRMLRDWLLDMNESCLDKLKEIALRSELEGGYDFLDRDHHVANVEEACFVDSEAGWLLKMYEIKLQVKTRLDEERKAEIAREEAERTEHERLAEIAKAKQQRDEATAKLDELTGK